MVGGKFENLPKEDIDNIPPHIIKELASRPGDFKYFYDKVKTGAEYDLKNNVYKNFNKSGVVIDGKKYAGDIPGNLMYGYIGASMGFSGQTLRVMAGLQQKNHLLGQGKEIPNKWEETYYDYPEDQKAIQAGVDLFKQKGKNISAKAIRKSLDNNGL